MINFISKIFKPTVIEEAVKKEQLQTVSKNSQRKVTFRVDTFMHKSIEGLIENTNLNISIIVKSALYDYISSYKILESEPFELGHWLDGENLDLSAGRYTITLDDTLSNELNRLEDVYRANGLKFNKSHFIRCAVVDRIISIMLDDS